MKKFVPYLLVLFPLFGYTQWEQNPIVTFNVGEFILYEEYDSTYMNSPLKFYYKYDSLSNYLGNSKIFPKNGKWISFYKQDSSKVASIFNVKNNKQNGLSTTFRFDGNKESEVNLKDNVINGYWVSWHKNGQISNIKFMKSVDFGNFYKEVCHGTFQTWFENGQISSTTEYVNGVEKGESLKYYKNGQIRERLFYDNGKKNGIYEIYHDNGKKYKMINYVDGIPEDQESSESFHPNGILAQTGKLEKGQQIGLWKSFYTSGNIMSEGFWEIIKREENHGPIFLSVKSRNWKFYYPSGQLMANGDFDIAEESYRYFDDEYESFRNTSWKYYDINGNEINREQFEKQGKKLLINIQYED